MVGPTQYIAYYRVSTQRQGRSGLGLEAQQETVRSFLNGRHPIAEYTDIESGKQTENRPQLLAALAYAKKTGAKLIVAKLDRLSRDVSFIAHLMNSAVKFTCCDLPEANEFTIHLMAALAQMERKLISDRTKAALQARKARGFKLGNPKNFTEAFMKSGPAACRRKADNNPNNVRAIAMVKALKHSGMGLSAMAKGLNEAGFKTSEGCSFTAVQVSRLLKKAA